jgi:hypothetical protein
MDQIEMFNFLVRGGLVLLALVFVPVFAGIVIEAGRTGQEHINQIGGSHMRTIAEVFLGILALVGIIVGTFGRCLELVGDVLMAAVERMYAGVTGDGE